MDKGLSPFYPSQPVPVGLFAGRQDQLDRITRRGIGQVERGEPISIFVQGEYGIGKSCVARYAQFLAAKNHRLVPIYASLGPAQTPEDLAARIVEGTIRAGQIHHSRGNKSKTWLARYIAKQELSGFTVNLEALRADAAKIASVHGLLDFLGQARKKSAGTKGVFLVLDEIDGLANQPWFAQLIKNLVDTNALAPKPLPLLLMICGTEDERRRMIENHPPVERIFDVIELEPLSDDEMREFFQRAFELAGTKVTGEGMQVLTRYGAGLPEVMHLIGDWAYWKDQDLVIDEHDAITAVVHAAEEFGRKHIDQQVLAALQSPDDRSILSKIASDVRFLKQEVEQGLDEAELEKFHNFLQKMETLDVLRSGSVKGEYIFNMNPVRLYLFLQRAELARNSAPE